MRTRTVLPSFFISFVIIFCSFTSAVKADELIKAPPVKLASLTNPQQQISLEEYKGNIIYLDFWASWCAPCRKSLPLLNELRNELNAKGFEVLAINVDEERADGLRFLDEYPVDYPTLFDNGDAASAYQLRGMPTAYLIDREGNLHSQHVGFNPNDMPTIRKKIMDLLSSSPH